MSKNILNSLRGCLILISSLLIFASCTDQKTESSSQSDFPAVTDPVKQKATLEKLLSLLPRDRTNNGRVSFLDETFQDWLKRTGELPPDFDRMPSIPFLPDPLVIDEGGKNIPVKTMAQWKEKRKWMKDQLEYYITGTYPPKPENLEVKTLSHRIKGKPIIQDIPKWFTTNHQVICNHLYKKYRSIDD